MVAVGNLEKVCFLASDDVAVADMQDAFRSLFGFGWTEVLDVAETSFDYVSANEVFFSINNLRPLKDLTLEKFLEKQGIQRPPNIVVS